MEIKIYKTIILPDALYRGDTLSVNFFLMFKEPCIARCVFYITKEMQLTQCSKEHCTEIRRSKRSV